MLPFIVKHVYTIHTTLVVVSYGSVNMALYGIKASSVSASQLQSPWFKLSPISESVSMRVSSDRSKLPLGVNVYESCDGLACLLAPSVLGTSCGSTIPLTKIKQLLKINEDEANLLNTDTKDIDS